MVTIAIGSSACIDEGDDEIGSIEAEAIVPNRLLNNNEVIGGADVTVADVQAVLEYYGSALATYREGGKSAARWIVEAGRGSNISPVYLLGRIDTESGLVRSGTLAHLSAATGCGCPDGATCDPNLAGFGLQVRCAAEKMRKYLTSLETNGSTISGWRVGTGKRTLDPCWVVPANKVTAALYTYTPWVGAYATGCGTSQWGGSSLVALLTRRFASTLEMLDPPAPSTDLVVDNANGNNDPTVARFEASANWIATSATSGHYGGNYRYASVNAVSDAATFWFYLDAAGTRRLDARWTAGGNRSTTAPFIIDHATGTAVVRVNQQRDHATWKSLGQFQFAKGWNRVRLSRWTSDGTVVIADAVRVR
ncbi:MAG TPA: hypothetical protein VML75_15685 [Kofleriaceae bacterium]|nr:hypothetical protein [Kofleriaceae bacterium]